MYGKTYVRMLEKGVEKKGVNGFSWLLDVLFPSLLPFPLFIPSSSFFLSRTSPMLTLFSYIHTHKIATYFLEKVSLGVWEKEKWYAYTQGFPTNFNIQGGVFTYSTVCVWEKEGELSKEITRIPSAAEREGGGTWVIAAAPKNGSCFFNGVMPPPPPPPPPQQE